MLAIIGSYRRNRYLPDCLASLNLVTGIDRIIIVDDSGDQHHRNQLTRSGHEWLPVADGNAGYNQAMQTVWHTARQHGGGHVLFVEEDFTFTQPVNVTQWADHLDANPHLSQIVAQRNPWFANEIAAGGMLQALTGDREQVDGFIEHRLFFSCNPTALPRRTFELDWPEGAWSENQFRDRLLTNPNMRFAITPDIIVEHTGERTGHSY